MAEFVEVIKQRNRMCLHESMNCYICELKKYAIDCGEDCDTILLRKPQETEKIIMDWATEHPIVTNGDKFKEIFGIIHNHDCPFCGLEVCLETDGCAECDRQDFWRQEWKDPKEKADE